MKTNVSPSTILQDLGHFSQKDLELFEQHIQRWTLQKHAVLLHKKEVCTEFYFILSGCFAQFVSDGIDQQIVDLHMAHEWMFNQESLIAQTPSRTIIQAFSSAEILSLSLGSMHQLCAQSPAFLQFGKILNQTADRSFIFDHGLTPLEKYSYILEKRPQLLQVFPIKVVASYLKMAPETLSRVRAQL